jgi:hypothetical protein
MQGRCKQAVKMSLVLDDPIIPAFTREQLGRLLFTGLPAVRQPDDSGLFAILTSGPYV